MSEKISYPNLDQVAALAVPLSVVLAERSFPLEQILELRPGTILELAARHGSPLEARINGSPVGRGQAVDLDERLGFRLDQVRGLKEQDFAGA
ncbi:MAG: FliM/FliN family flagellar motor switch protein [Planctomycetes bacterium]|nr:FliM/FliN family flagellar motor switch protein [Planctomycetota bacterium]